MNTYTFTKSNGHWFITLPVTLREYNNTDYTHIESEGGALDTIANGRIRVSINLDIKPFENAFVLEMQAFTDGVEFCYYQLLNAEGVLLKDYLPLSGLSLLLYGELQERIYLRRKIIE